MVSPPKALITPAFVIFLAFFSVSNNTLAAQTEESWATRLKNRMSETIESAKNNPIYFGAIAAGSIAAVYIIWQATNRIMNPAIAPELPAKPAVPAKVMYEQQRAHTLRDDDQKSLSILSLALSDPRDHVSAFQGRAETFRMKIEREWLEREDRKK